MTKMWRYAAMASTVVVLAACGGDDPAEDAGDTTTATTSAEGDAATGMATATEETGTAAGATGTTADGGTTADDVTLATGSVELGTIVVDGEGMTLYVFDNDTGGESTCYEGCAQTWPPLVGEAAAGDGIDASLLGTTERTDGSMQVTYDGNPLYFYAPDSAPGDTAGQGVGGVWWVVAPDGTKITDGGGSGSANQTTIDY